MSYVRIKTIKKKNGKTYKYLYRQTSVRKGKKVSTISEFLGAVGSAGLVGVLAVRDAAGLDKVSVHRPQASTHTRANKIQEAYERELYAKDRPAFDRLNRFQAFKEKGYREAEKERREGKGEKRERAEAKDAAQKKWDADMDAIREFNEAREAEKPT